MKAVIFLCVQPKDGWLAETCRCLYFEEYILYLMECKLSFILVIFTVLQNNACVGSLSSTTVSKNNGYSWIKLSAAAVLQINVLDTSAIITLIT